MPFSRSSFRQIVFGSLSGSYSKNRAICGGVCARRETRGHLPSMVRLARFPRMLLLVGRMGSVYDLDIHCMVTKRGSGCRMMNESQQESVASRPPAGTEKLIAIGRLAGNTAHKINNHLTTILTFSHLMRDKANMDAQDREDLDLIIREAMQAAIFARDLQDFTRSGD
jgi:hypothetical protein